MRWQFHSIHLILRRLIHPGNAFGLRESGIKLFLLWYQILQENASQDCHYMFMQLVCLNGHSYNKVVPLDPNPPNPSSSFSPFSSAWPNPIAHPNAQDYATASEGWLQEAALPLLLSTVSNETSPDKTLQVMLQDMVYEGAMIQWDYYPMQNGDNQDEDESPSDADARANWVIYVNNKQWLCHQAHQMAFNFLWTSFKKYYLLGIFPEFDEATDLYDPKFELGKAKAEDFGGGHQKKSDPLESIKCRESVIFWVTEYVKLPKKNSQMKTHRQTSSVETTSQRISEETITREETLKDENSTLKSTFQSTGESDTLTHFSSIQSEYRENTRDVEANHSHEEEDPHGDVFDFVQEVLFSTRCVGVQG